MPDFFAANLSAKCVEVALDVDAELVVVFDVVDFVVAVEVELVEFPTELVVALDV